MNKISPLLIIPDWPAPASVRACTTVCGPQADFDLRKPECQQQLTTLAALPAPPAWLHQTHGTRAVSAYTSNTADASFTDKTGQVCAVLTADCLPVLLTDSLGKRVAAIHAGWRGLAGGILRETVEAGQFMPVCTLAWLGPAISEAHFEVGPEVREAFLTGWPNCGFAFRKGTGDRWMANLYALATHQLHALGIHAVYGGTHCTYAESSRFFSYRREKDAGRMATLIWMI